jgi:hypothetical protein
MFTVHSTLALNWPIQNFRIKKGFNQFKSRDAIPAEVMRKLEYLATPKKTRDGQRIAAVVRFDGQVVETAASSGAGAELDGAVLSKMSLKDLQKLAADRGVDVQGLQAKKQVADAILAAASSGAGAELDGDDSDDSDDDLDDEDDDA